MHYYQHNIGDYARDTGHLSVLEHGIYRLLLDWCYLNEKPITTEQAIRVSRGNPLETQSVLSEFFLQESDGWVHKRVQKEVSAYHGKVLVNRQNGSKGGRPKPTNNPVGSQSGSENNPNQEPITNNQKPIEDKDTPRKRSAPPVQKPMATVQQLGEAGIPADVAAEFIAHKASMKAPLTERAWRDHLAESKKAGWSPLQAAEKVMAKSWKGFEAKYVANEPAPGKQAFTSFAQQAADIARTTVPAKPGKDPALASIERDMTTAAPIPLEVLEKMAAIRSTISGSR